MSKKLEKVKEWVLKTGYPLELEVIDELKSHGWEVMASTNYFDEDEGKWRELDVKAYRKIEFGKVKYAPEWSYALDLTLIIQCKKSEKFAWILFPAEGKEDLWVRYIDFLKVARTQSLAARDPSSIRWHRILGVCRSILMEPPLLNEKAARQIKWLGEIAPFGFKDFKSFAKKEIATIGTVVPLSGKGKAPNELFEAAATATKATVYELELISNYHYTAISLFQAQKKEGFKPCLSINIVLPVIVFDGTLCMWRGKDKELEEVSHVVHAFNYRSLRYFGEYAINVLTKDQFPIFLRELGKDQESLCLRFKEKTYELDEQVRLFLTGKFL